MVDKKSKSSNNLPVEGGRDPSPIKGLSELIPVGEVNSGGQRTEEEPDSFQTDTVMDASQSDITAHNN